jgi:hypothetical protein
MSNNTRAIDTLGPVALALALTLAAGCAARQVSNPPPGAALDSALRSLSDRERLLTSLQTPAIMDYSGPSGHFKTREQFAVQRPGSVRVDAMSPLGVALVVAIDDVQIAVFNPSDNTLIRGPANAATLARFTRIPMAPAQAVRLLLALAPESSSIADTPASAGTEGEMKVFSYTGIAGNYELGFNNDHLALVRARDADGRVTYEVRYADYRDIGAMKFPFELDADFMAAGTRLKLRYLNPSIDRPIANSAFVLSPQPGTRLIQLGFASPSIPDATRG